MTTKLSNLNKTWLQFMVQAALFTYQVGQTEVVHSPDWCETCRRLKLGSALWSSDLDTDSEEMMKHYAIQLWFNICYKLIIKYWNAMTIETYLFVDELQIQFSHVIRTGKLSIHCISMQIYFRNKALKNIISEHYAIFQPSGIMATRCLHSI